MRCDCCLESDDGGAFSIEMHVTCDECLEQVEKEAKADIAKALRAAVEQERSEIIRELTLVARAAMSRERAEAFVGAAAMVATRSGPPKEEATPKPIEPIAGPIEKPIAAPPDARQLAIEALENISRSCDHDFKSTTCPTRLLGARALAALRAVTNG